MDNIKKITDKEEICATIGGDEELIHYVEEEDMSLFTVVKEEVGVNSSHSLLNAEIAFHGCKRSGIFKK